MSSPFFRSMIASPSRLLVAFSLLMFMAPAQAELQLTGWYGGFMYSDSSEELDLDSGGTLTNSKGLMKIKAGKTLNEYLSLEGQLGMTTNTGDKRGRFTYGLYLRANKDFGSYRLYGLLGGTGFHDYHDVEEDVDESGASVGLGIEVFGSKTTALSLEYLRMIDKSVDQGDFLYESIGIGFSYYFIDDTSYFNRNRDKIKSIRY